MNKLSQDLVKETEVLVYVNIMFMYSAIDVQQKR